MNVDLKVLSFEAHQNARRKGFWDDNDNVPQRIALIHDEFDEAFEEIMVDAVPAPYAMYLELADIVIRIGDLAGRLGLALDQWTVFGMPSSAPWIKYAAPTLPRARVHVSRALRVHREGGKPRVMALHLSQCVRVLYWHCEAVGVDLFGLVAEKMEANRERPRMHGKLY